MERVPGGKCRDRRAGLACLFPVLPLLREWGRLSPLLRRMIRSSLAPTGSHRGLSRFRWSRRRDGLAGLHAESWRDRASRSSKARSQLWLMIADAPLLVQAVALLANTPRSCYGTAVPHLSRPGNQTRVILLAVGGLGALLIVGSGEARACSRGVL